MPSGARRKRNRQGNDLFSAGSYGKMSAMCCPLPTTHSDVSWRELSEQMIPCQRLTAGDGRVLVWLPGRGHGRHGGFSTLNTSDSPNDASACSLSQVLETMPIPQRYFLSAEACAGILRRAAKRGKTLPEHLQRALQRAAALAPTSTLTED